MTRVTITEIARRSGVSKGAVSYALNNRPGVSEATRARVLQVAQELDWVPNSAARMLSGSRTDTVGLVLARRTSTLAFEPFYMEFIAGIESELSRRSHGLLLQVVPDPEAELATYRTWSSQRRVDAVVVVDVRVDDQRVPLLRRLGLPAVLAGDPSLTGGLATVWTDDATAAREVVDHLAGLGHARLGRVAGMPELGHVSIRGAAFERAAAAAGLSLVTVHTDFSGDDGARATRELLAADPRPTALVYDNDLMAVAGLSVASDLGLSVPHELSLVAWDDSALCRVTHPPLSAVSHDVIGYGAAVARCVFARVTSRSAAPATAQEPPVPAAHLAATPRLSPRGSTAPPQR